MLGVLNASAEGFFLRFHWKTFLFMMFGISLGMIFGLIPGLSGLTGMSLLLPIAITQPPEVAVAFLLGMYAVTTQTDAIPAVLIGVPGTSAAQATYLDGYPMAQRGEAGRALSASYFASVRGCCCRPSISPNMPARTASRWIFPISRRGFPSCPSRWACSRCPRCWTCCWRAAPSRRTGASSTPGQARSKGSRTRSGIAG